MARSLSVSQANRVIKVLVAEFLPLYRRGYAAAAAATSDAAVSVRVGLIRSIEEKPVLSEARSPWAPDPVTGYYRPINCTPQIDPVELRQMLLNHKFRSSH
ncbi:late embryogenesis abundant protein Lea5-like [Lotus japonicus]|uniref:Late embryogenesis abundant protein Lea5 n=1 Tax=Lotus japonicus TaxID=34305 RepID=I3SI94_LOTJA|nr:late embryogenesis abundant protein Lea5-like [Lotus japonicus]AFK39986.1 unknown [Lotus japonicus]